MLDLGSVLLFVGKLKKLELKSFLSFPTKSVPLGDPHELSSL